jgi:hypothetical protein
MQRGCVPRAHTPPSHSSESASTQLSLGLMQPEHPCSGALGVCQVCGGAVGVPCGHPQLSGGALATHQSLVNRHQVFGVSAMCWSWVCIPCHPQSAPVTRPTLWSCACRRGDLPGVSRVRWYHQPPLLQYVGRQPRLPAVLGASMSQEQHNSSKGGPLFSCKGPTLCVVASYTRCCL